MGLLMSYPGQKILKNYIKSPISFSSFVRERDERRLLRTIHTLRKEVGNTFTSGQIKEEASLSHVSNRTVRHYLYESNFYFRHLRRKGLLTAKDRNNQVKFVQKLINRLSNEFWTEGVSFYFY